MSARAEGEGVYALEVRRLSKAFGGVQAVDDVSFALRRGELLAMIGPNGAGKTTTFNMLNGQIPPDSGSVTLDGRELVGLKPREVWRLGVGRTFQITATFRSMTAIENVQMAFISAARRTFALAGAARRRFRAESMGLLELVGMADQSDRHAAELAYGDLKRLELAVALAHAPTVLLMDEPTAGMAPQERIDLMAFCDGIVRERGVSILFTEHDMDVVFAHAHRIIVLNRGRLIAEGDAEAIRADPHVQEVYLGGGTVFKGLEDAGGVRAAGEAAHG